MEKSDFNGYIGVFNQTYEMKEQRWRAWVTGMLRSLGVVNSNKQLDSVRLFQEYLKS